MKLDWEFTFNAIQAAAAAIVTGLAIWGVFFLTLSDNEKSQYEIQISEIRGDLVLLQTELVDAKETISSLNDDAKQIEVDIAGLEIVEDRLTFQNAALADQQLALSKSIEIRSDELTTLYSNYDQLQTDISQTGENFLAASDLLQALREQRETGTIDWGNFTYESLGNAGSFGD